MTKANDIITKASKYIGVKENPKGSNKVKFNTDYYGSAVSGSAYPWCVTFVWDIFRMCKASKLFYNGEKTASCGAVLTWAKQNKLIVSEGKKGDLVLFDWNKDGRADHIGIIVAKNSDGTYKTIEGNTSIGNDSNGGEVMERKRNKSDILAFIRPKYEKETTTVKPKIIYIVGQTYTLQEALNVRTGAGTQYRWKNRKELTADGKKHAKMSVKAVLKKGTKITCLGSKNGWVKIPSGWVRGYSTKKVYIK